MYTIATFRSGPEYYSVCPESAWRNWIFKVKLSSVLDFILLVLLTRVDYIMLVPFDMWMFSLR
jgi:hypothetical protein